MTAFDVGRAFCRNLGWVTREEQGRLREARVAIAGLGGVGGHHLLTLTRLGIGKLSIADFDVFALENFNRQAGASVSTLGHAKIDIACAQARDINPELEIRTFQNGIDDRSIPSFLDGVDLYIDGLDFFAFDVRRAVFAECERRRIPAITVAPLGMGAALLVFMPGRMTFERYFGPEGSSDLENGLRFLVGLAPSGLQMKYLVDRSRVRLDLKQGPSTPMACLLCAGVAGTEALKILLGRGPTVVAPRGLHYDAYRQRLTKTWIPGGYRNPVQRMRYSIARLHLESALRNNMGFSPQAEAR